MSKKSIFYKYPQLYIWGLKWIHKGNFTKRYRFMASFVKKGDLVLEPACGPAILADFLPQDSHYRGFDTNKEFINYARRKHSGVYLGNVLDIKNYPQADVVIICDILHHLNPANRKKFVNNCFSSTKKVFIICEPGKRSKPADSIFYSLRKRLAEWSEKDGTGDFKTEYFLSRGQLLSQIKHGFDIMPSAIKREVKEFGEDIVAVFYKDKSFYQKTRRQRTVSAIVPIFNEEKTLAKVIETLLKSNLIDEVICVNDGSTDKSLAILKKFKDKIRVINLKKNSGKGYALVEGIKNAKSEIVAFIDADLTNLSDNHINTLFEPVLEDKFKAVLGYPSSGWMPDVFSNLTGERVYLKKDLFPHLERMAKTRFGVEIFLNELFKNETKEVPLKQLKGLYKYEKRNPTDTIKEYLGETIEIAQEIGRREGLLTEDERIIANLVNVNSFKELNKRIKHIQNMRVKQFLGKYVLNYVKKTKKWWQNFE
jgi:glycosyltransferase involved in cell wall biosynthesis/SAM-dependent methyltransferase